MGRREDREDTFKLIFIKEARGENIEDIIPNEEESNELQYAEFTTEAIKDMEDKLEEIDTHISKHLDKWTIDRISKVSLAILRVATYEIFYKEDIPTSVSINEAVEIAKKFGGEEDSKFVNGVLGSMAKSIS